MRVRVSHSVHGRVGVDPFRAQPLELGAAFVDVLRGRAVGLCGRGAAGSLCGQRAVAVLLGRALVVLLLLLVLHWHLEDDPLS